MSDFAGRVIVVTGALGHLGAALARHLASLGTHLVLVDRLGEKLRATFGPDDAGRLTIGDVNLGFAPAAAGVFETAQLRFGRIDGLVHTVGGFRGGSPIHEDDPGNWDFLYEINVKTTLHTCRAAVPHLLRQRSGSIVTIGSRAALAGDANYGPYCAAKAAVVRITEALAAELKPHGVRANCVLPGTLDTPVNRAAMPTADFATWVPLGEVVAAITFLLSDASRAITGAAVPVFGRG